jgi:type I restriction enzyme S subunit
MTNLPVGWVEATLGDVCTVVSGSTPKSAEAAYWSGDIPWITPDDLSHHRGKRINVGRRSITQAGLESCSARMVPAGTVLYTSRAPIGYVAIAERAVCTNQGFKSLVPPAGVSSDYLYWYMRYVTPEVRARASGTTFAEISGKAIKAVPLRLAPFAEQGRIAAAIEEQFSRLDVGIGALGRIRQNLMQMRSAVLARAVHGWPETPLENISRVFVGSTPSRSRHDFWGGEIPWVASGEVAFGRIHQTRETITEEGLGSAARLHPPGTVLLAMIGEGKTRGQAAILDIAATHNQNSAAVRLDKRSCLPEWLFYVLMARYEETRRGSSGGNQPALNSRRVRAIPIPLPAIDQQRRTVGEIEQRLSLIGALATEADRIVHRGEVLRAAILKQAFTGKLVPQDSNDEPASILLGRILAERASSNGQKPSKARGQRQRKVTV